MRLSIRLKLYMSFAIIIALFLTTTVVSNLLTNRIVRLTDSILQSEVRLEVVQRINLFARTVNDNGAHYMLAPMSSERDFESRFKASVSYLEDEIDKLDKLTQDERSREQIEDFRRKWSAYLKVKWNIIDQKEQGQVGAAQVQYTRNSFDPVAFALHAFSKEEQERIDGYRSTIERSVRLNRTLTYSAASAAIVLSLVVAFVLSNWMVRRIDRLKSSAQTVARGNLDVPPLHFQGKDELRDLAEAFNTMTGSLRSVVDSNQLLQQLSERDGLTGIANRRRYDSGLAQEWERLVREGGELSLVLCDIDYFKRFNDYYGHQEGDRCLRLVAGVIQEAAHDRGALAARYGGEEFVVLMPDSSLDDALGMAERIREGIDALRLPHRASRVGETVTLSLGVAHAVPSSGEPPEELLKRADGALYEAKEAGRNRIGVSGTERSNP
ncbi:diguanylate cyclase [Paenibacillus spiritus]|uniref:Diguanylate cyclase n=1 Tax=Paenibacillus spiritus TaxID=2496557 RepID=A0A5J5FVL2_9BACL|nr:diguanylate cyclase [Paenibacillus spiritus]KAA8997545.1 diguanylate cyclase [Paenibacillus spiritus]